MEKLTESQRLAVEAKGSRILVSAGAGAGKTRVLTARVQHLIDHIGIAPERILALTFSDQAANEMKERIDRKLGKTDVTVLTFHRFCGRIVRDNPLLADVDPAFAMLDESTSHSFLRETIERELYSGNSDELIHWVEQCGPKTALDLFLAFYEHWRETSYSLDALQAKTEARLADEVRKCQEEIQTIMSQLHTISEGSAVKASGTLARMEKILAAWQVYTRLGWQRPHSRASKEETVYLQAEKCLHSLFGEVTRNVSKEVKDCFGKLSVWKKDQLWRELLTDQTARFRESFFAWMERTDQAYRMLKEIYGWCDFADLQRKAYMLLHDQKELREKYGMMYTHVLVDEYQDTSPIQQQILEQLEAGSDSTASLFMVGDARQSIYRFRGADVSGFEQMRKQLGDSDAYISMRENFRSAPSLVAFFAEMTRQLFGDGEIVSGLSESRSSNQPVVEVLIPALEEDCDPREAEARLVAQRINELGPALWGDVAILLQTRTHLAKYQQALEELEIPYVVHAGNGYWKRQAVHDLYHLVRLVENVEDDIALLGFLRGPLVGLSEHGLWRVAEQAGLRQGFLNFMENEDISCSAEDRKCLREAKRILLRARSLHKVAGLADWLHMLLHEEGLAEQLGFPDFAPVIVLADELEKRGEFHLSDLLLWWQRLREGDDKEDTQQKENAHGKVKIMTIHAAKGLEFPIVFIPDLSHRYTKGIGRLHFSRDWGLANQQYHQDVKEWLPTLGYIRACEDERKAMIDEQKRLLYVAMTRAQEQLIFSGAAASFTDKPSIEECSNWFDWLPFLVPELRNGASDQVIRRPDWSLQVRVGMSHEPFLRATQKVTAMEKLDSPTSEKHVTARKKRFSQRIWSVSEWVELLADEQKKQKRNESVSYWRHESNRLQAYEWGHVLHRILEHLQGDHDLDYACEHLLKMALASIGLTSREAHETAWEHVKNDVATYMKSELHKECRRAKTLHSEMPFAIRLFGDDQDKGSLLLNGVMDKVWVRPDGKATIVDFKTHKYKNAAQAKRIVETYTPQLQLYAHAVEQLLGWRVDRAGLYMTATGSYMEVPCDLRARGVLFEKMHEIWTKAAIVPESEKRLFSL